MPALALAGAMSRLDSQVEPVLVGAERGVEARILPERRYRYHLLPAEPIYRRAIWRNLRWPLLMVRLLRRGARVLADEEPALAVGTGGYAAGPILWQAVRRGIPLALQEQNAVPGATTRWLAKHARQVHLGYPEAQRRLQCGAQTEVFTSGNPIVPPPKPRPEPRAQRDALGLQPNRPVVFVVGGSQGALSVNRAVAAALEADLLRDVTLLWSTGRGSWSTYERFDSPPQRLVRPFWDPISEAYAAADLVVARAGAMTTAELCAWSLPSLLVPLPTAAANHQHHNALAMERAGASLHLADQRLSGDLLADTLRALLAAPERLAQMRRAAAQRGHPKAAEEIAKRLLALVS
jgi:UDP-N-acetylglucosamine--N-acetylmuramyl-(pentapeptide) pyrophosphoryl-undecaprenol N-acetylglucosamine transferase